MTSIFEVLPLEHGYAAVREAVMDVVAAAQRDGRYAIVRLREAGTIPNEKSVIVVFSPCTEAACFDALCAVRWLPENGALFPQFEGSLSLHYTEAGRTELVIHGEYIPPFSPIAGALDLMLGQRVASLTCRTLLAHIRDSVEERCSRYEKAPP